MRHWLLIALIALLPLRSWAADAMAARMLVQPVAAAGHGAAAMPVECPGHAAASKEGAPTGTVDSAACGQCELCSTVAPRLAAPMALVPQLPHARPLTADRTFASAWPLRLLRPPIS